MLVLLCEGDDGDDVFYFFCFVLLYEDMYYEVVFYMVCGLGLFVVDVCW